jgi:hypothetical protein
MHLFATTTPGQILELGKKAAIVEVEKTPRRATKTTARRRKS